MLTEKKKETTRCSKKEKNIRAKGRKREREKTIASHEARSQLFHSSSRGTTMVIIVILITITGLKTFDILRER